MKNKKEEITKFLSEGLLRNSQNISNSAGKGFMAKYSFDRTLSIAVSPLFKRLSQLIEKFAVDWFLECINKYPEEYFHLRMSGYYTARDDGQYYPGFDYIADWQDNHKTKFWVFLNSARGLYKGNKENIILDRGKYLNRIVTVIEMQGWRVNHHETMGLYFVLDRLFKMIES